MRDATDLFRDRHQVVGSDGKQRQTRATAELERGKTSREDGQIEQLINPFATGDAYMRQLFHCLQWYAGSERVNEWTFYLNHVSLKTPGSTRRDVTDVTARVYVANKSLLCKKF